MLTDVAMPGITGVEVAHQSRQRRPGLPILFASGYVDVQTFGPELSEEVVLKKPYRLDEPAARPSAGLAGAATGGNFVTLRR